MLNGFIVSKLVFKCFTHANNKFCKTGKANQYVSAGTRCIFVLAKLIWCTILCFVQWVFWEYSCQKEGEECEDNDQQREWWKSLGLIHKLVSPTNHDLSKKSILKCILYSPVSVHLDTSPVQKTSRSWSMSFGVVVVLGILDSKTLPLSLVQKT